MDVQARSFKAGRAHAGRAWGGGETGICVPRPHGDGLGDRAGVDVGELASRDERHRARPERIIPIGDIRHGQRSEDRADRGRRRAAQPRRSPLRRPLAMLSRLPRPAGVRRSSASGLVAGIAAEQRVDHRAERASRRRPRCVLVGHPGRDRSSAADPVERPAALDRRVQGGAERPQIRGGRGCTRRGPARAR